MTTLQGPFLPGCSGVLLAILTKDFQSEQWVLVYTGLFWLFKAKNYSDWNVVRVSQQDVTYLEAAWGKNRLALPYSAHLLCV